MTTLLTAPFLAQLLARRASLLEQLATLRGGTKGRAEASAEHFGHPDDHNAELLTEREMEFALDAREGRELDAVDAALQRINAGTYGLCIDCGAHIAPARLQATPEAARCMHCQEKSEQKH
jgi:DnaK suppressor protein